MKLSEVHLMLNSLINYFFSSSDTGFPSILHRIATEGLVVRSGRPGHKILCKEMDRDQRKVQPAFNTLSEEQQKIVVVKYMPYTIDGRPALDRERARFVDLSARQFADQYHAAAKKVKKRLT